MSQLIMVGTVANVLPAINTDPIHLMDIETHSVITVEKVLYGTYTSGIQRVALVQVGGKAVPCALVVPADPLVQPGEQYIFFLRHDDERPMVPNTTGFPRYWAVGYWSGKARVVSGKIQFLPSAHQRLHEYDNMDASLFISTVEEEIKSICAWHDVSFPCLLPKK